MDQRPQVKPDPRRALPAVGRLVERVREAAPALPSWAALAGVRRTLDAARRALARGRVATLDPDALAQEARRRADALARSRPARVVNATGVVLHTNLGRAVLAPEAARAVAEAAMHYGDLELDLETGRRGQRLAPVEEKLVLLSGAEAALAVNNNAAALLLAVATLAGGREVIVSRGELVEIGGSFRLPEVLAAAGVRLVEVGTTNRTHPQDYRAAVGAESGLLLKVHRSNFVQEGFVREVALAELAAIARDHELPLVEDLGSATLVDLRGRGLPEESFAPARLALGADVVCFSGDKLLGGPQAGIVIGASRALDAMRRHPLARALRLDKLTLAALDWTLGALLAGREDELPTLAQLGAGPQALEQRARALAARLGARGVAGLEVSVAPSRAPVGGGSLPGFALDSWAVRLRGPAGPDALAAQLRRAAVPVIGRVAEDVLLLDVRTLLAGDEDAIDAALSATAR